MKLFRATTGAFAAALLAAPEVAEASPRGVTIDVNNTLDLPDADLLDGVPDADLVAPGLQTTLRCALMHANATPGADTIVLPEGTFLLTIQGTFEDACATGDLDVSEDVTITGAGVATTILDGKKAKDRVFEVLIGASLTISGVTIQKGKAPKDEIGFTGGGGIFSQGDLSISQVRFLKCSSPDDGGAIEQFPGLLQITDTVFEKNKTKDDGGAIDVDAGQALLMNVTFYKNKASDEGGALESSGGDLTLENVTFSANKAKAQGGAISIEDLGTTAINGCTFVDNKAAEGGAISTLDGAALTSVQNTIFGRNKSENCDAPLTTLGGNLDFGNTCGLGFSELHDTDPQLGPLGDHGGFTPTHPLPSTSPAIDAGNDAGCLPTDQRGLGRVDVPGVGTAVCDAGAYEFQG